MCRDLCRRWPEARQPGLTGHLPPPKVGQRIECQSQGHADSPSLLKQKLPNSTVSMFDGQADGSASVELSRIIARLGRQCRIASVGKFFLWGALAAVSECCYWGGMSGARSLLPLGGARWVALRARPKMVQCRGALHPTALGGTALVDCGAAHPTGWDGA